MTETWRQQKQQIVREAIYDAAISLFETNGFDDTNVEQIAEAAGVSRRSFFRYFASKDDLLAHTVVDYGRSLVGAVQGCQVGLSDTEVIARAVFAGAEYTANQLHLRQVIRIAERSASARQAHQSRLMQVEDSLTQAFAHRNRKSKHRVDPRLLTGLTLTVMNTAIVSWYRGKDKNLGLATERILKEVRQVFSAETGVTAAARKSSTLTPPGKRKSRPTQ